MNQNEILYTDETVMIHIVVGTGVLDGNPQKLVNSLSGNPCDCPFNETIFFARRYVCNGQSGTPVPTTT